MPEIAKTTLAVYDEGLGFDRKIIEGQTVPEDLLVAYKNAGGQTADAPGGARPAKYIDARGEEHELPVATETVALRDESMGVDRKVFAGQAVPADLVEAYYAKTGGAPAPAAAPPASKYDGWRKDQLEAEVDRLELDVTGTGANGNVKVEDLTAALEAHDAAQGA